MKKIIILIIAVFVQVNVYGNTEIECIEVNTNDDLIEKLSLTPEMSNLRKLSFLSVLMKSNFANKKKECIEITAGDYKAYEETIEVAKTNYNKLLNANPEFKNLEAVQQKEVFMASIQKNATDDLEKIGTCFLGASAFYACIEGAGAISKVVFGTCVFVTGAADIYAAINLAAAFVSSVVPVIEGELAFCSELAYTSGVVTCILGVEAAIICCIALEFGISFGTC